MLEQSISRVLFPVSVTLYGTTVIHLAPILLLESSNLPGDSDGQPSNVPLFGLAPGGVCQASDVTIGAVSSYLAFSPLPFWTLDNGLWTSDVWYPWPTVHSHNLKSNIQHPKRRYVFCGTFPCPAVTAGPVGVTHHRCPLEPGLSSPASLSLKFHDCFRHL